MAKSCLMDFRLVSDYEPRGDQANAIESLIRGLADREQHQVLLGVTGSGKTFTMAKVIEKTGRPALVWRITRRWRRSSTTSSELSFRRTRSNISSATTITTSLKRTFPPATFT